MHWLCGFSVCNFFCGKAVRLRITVQKRPEMGDCLVIRIADTEGRVKRNGVQMV